VAAAPGLFSAGGSGFGQGYILNVDGTLNSPTNPAKAGNPITIFATGVGPLTLSGPSAATEFPSLVFIDGLSAAGGTATLAPVGGLAGNVFQLIVQVPNPPGVSIAPLVSVILQVNGVASQSGLALSVAQ
jgi:uncharacterized protein (TIGR03437 family)